MNFVFIDLLPTIKARRREHISGEEERDETDNIGDFHKSRECRFIDEIDARKPHVVAKSVGDGWGKEVAGSNKVIGRDPPEQGGVGELADNLRPGMDAEMVQMRQAEEQRRAEDGPEGAPAGSQEQGAHARAKDPFFYGRRNQDVPPDENITRDYSMESNICIMK